MLIIIDFSSLLFVPDKPVTLVIPLKDQNNKFVIGLGLDLVVLTWDWNTGFSTTSHIVSVDQDHPRNRFNDGKADANGRIWAGEIFLLSFKLCAVGMLVCSVPKQTVFQQPIKL